MLICGQDIFAGEKSLNLFRILMICVKDSFPGEKVFEYFQDNDDLRLRQFCRRQSFWRFSGWWWFAAKTFLQANKSLNVFRKMLICDKGKFAGEKVLSIFRIMMICFDDNFAGEKVFEYFQNKDDLRLRQFRRRKSLRISSGWWWFANETNLQAKKSLNTFRIMMIWI